MKKFLAIMLVLAMAIGLGACGSAPASSASSKAESSKAESSTAESSKAESSKAESSTAEKPKELTKVNVAYMPNYASLATIVAAVKTGAMEEQGLDVNLVEFADGPTIIAAMESGSIDYGYIGPGAHKLCIQGRAKVFALAQVGNADEVIGNSEKGVKTAADLKGKTVAYASGTSSEQILNFVLESAGLTIADITAMEMDASAITTAMVSGSVDACATWSPNTFSIKEQLGEKAVKLASNVDFADRDVAAASWIVMNDKIEKDHDQVVAFTKGLYAGMDYRSKPENIEQNCKWTAEVTGLDYEGVYDQRGDAEWIDSKTLIDWVNSGKLAEMYKVQQNGFIKNGVVDAEVPVEDYVLFDVMKDAAK